MFDPIAYINEPRWMNSRPGLERICELLERLGHPQESLAFVHVAGTNGKGSTCAYTASILQEAGFCVGLFTSPFVEVFEERIRVNGCNIALDELTDVTRCVREHAEAMDDHPTEFELMTAVALMHFARRACDIVVLEVGMGGRLDSTNAIGVPEVAVIARIGLDHTAFLGNTLAAVAAEKAGIIKEGCPVVSWPQEPEAMAVVEQVVAGQNATLTVPRFDLLVQGPIDQGGEDVLPSREFSYKNYQGLKTGLLASYQPANASLAIEAIEALRMRGWIVSDDALRAGIEKTFWPGRFEVIRGGKNRPRMVIDGGHNPQGAEALAASLAEVFPDARPVFIMGVLEDKEYKLMVRAVLPLASEFVTITPNNPRALAAEKLADTIRECAEEAYSSENCLEVRVAASIPDALEKACTQAGEQGLVCIFGSLYTLGAFKQELRAQGWPIS